MHAAAITLMRGDISLVADALDIAAHGRQDPAKPVLPFAYNVAGIPGGVRLPEPVVAGAAMAK